MTVCQIERWNITHNSLWISFFPVANYSNTLELIQWYRGWYPCWSFVTGVQDIYSVCMLVNRTCDLIIRVTKCVLPGCQFKVLHIDAGGKLRETQFVVYLLYSRGWPITEKCTQFHYVLGHASNPNENWISNKGIAEPIKVNNNKGGCSRLSCGPVRFAAAIIRLMNHIFHSGVHIAT